MRKKDDPVRIRADIIRKLHNAYSVIGAETPEEAAEIQDDLDHVVSLDKVIVDSYPGFRSPKMQGLDQQRQIIALHDQLGQSLPGMDCDWRKRGKTESEAAYVPGFDGPYNPLIAATTVKKPDMTSRWRDSQGHPVKSVVRGQSLCETDLKAKFGPCPMGDYLRGIVTDSWQHNPEIKAALSTTGSGHNLVPTEFANWVIDLARAESVLDEMGCTTIPMASDRLLIARQTADVTIAVHGENLDDLESTPTFDSIGLTAFGLGAVTYISRELAMDSPMASEQIAAALSKALGAAIDKFGLAGTGSAQPLGLTLRAGNDVAGVGSPDWGDVMAGILANQIDNHSSNALVLSPTRMMDLNLLLVNSEVNNYASPPPIAANLMHLQTTAIADTVGLVLDGTRCILGVREGMRVETTVVGGSTFAKHQLGLKVFGRVAFGLTHSNAVCTLSSLT